MHDARDVSASPNLHQPARHPHSSNSPTSLFTQRVSPLCHLLGLAILLTKAVALDNACEKAKGAFPFRASRLPSLD